MPERNTAILEAANAAITDGNYEGFLAFCTDDSAPNSCLAKGTKPMLNRGHAPNNHTRTTLHEKLAAYEQALDRLAAQVEEQLILPNDPTSDAERRVWNATIDRYPALIVRAATAEDVRAVSGLRPCAGYAARSTQRRA